MPKVHPIVCFGEILWDILPNETVPGGAPMNVAFHLKKLGLEPALITRVGLDNYGKRLIQLMEKEDITTEFFQMDFELDTGRVTMTPGEGDDIHYDIIKPVAWDHVQWDPQFLPLISQSSWFIYGSLAARSEASRNVLYRLLEAAPRKVLDINLRPPHYTRPVLEKLLEKVDMLKLNLGELELLTGWFSGYRSDNDRIRAIQDRFHIPTIILTKGSKGATMNYNGEFHEHPGFTVDVVDTVGSGDAFLAGLLYCLMQGAGPPAAIEFASAMGALIASHSGPCPQYDIATIHAITNKQQL
ncbi:MAG TPA: carbohydrate kinase [Puia sp.]